MVLSSLFITEKKKPGAVLSAIPSDSVLSTTPMNLTCGSEGILQPFQLVMKLGAPGNELIFAWVDPYFFDSNCDCRKPVSTGTCIQNVTSGHRFCFQRTSFSVLFNASASYSGIAICNVTESWIGVSSCYFLSLIFIIVFIILIFTLTFFKG